MIINQYEIANNSVKNMDKIYEECFSKKETLKTDTNKKKRFKLHSNKEMHTKPNYTFVSIRASCTGCLSILSIWHLNLLPVFRSSSHFLR